MHAPMSASALDSAKAKKRIDAESIAREEALDKKLETEPSERIKNDGMNM